MTRLRAVAPDEAAPKKRMSITEAADAGDQRELLVALRSRLAKAVEDPNCPPRDLASNSRRLQEIIRDIDALDAKQEQEASEDVVGDEEWDSSAL